MTVINLALTLRTKGLDFNDINFDKVEIVDGTNHINFKLLGVQTDTPVKAKTMPEWDTTALCVFELDKYTGSYQMDIERWGLPIKGTSKLKVHVQFPTDTVLQSEALVTLGEVEGPKIILPVEIVKSTTRRTTCPIITS